MKELSIEEKAKAYDEAIKYANCLINERCKEGTDGSFHRADLHKMFPQLKESEDERIRKYLKRIIGEWSYDDLFAKGFRKDDILAWLKKQGKQIEFIDGFANEFERQVSHLIISSINKEYEYTVDYVKWVSDGLLNYAKHEIEKQGEQNLVNMDLDELVIQLEETIGTSPHSRETIKDFFQKAVQKYMNCLKIANGEIGRLVEENYRLKEKRGGQNPTDEEMNTILSTEYEKGRADAIAEFQKEWSEDDEEMLEDVRFNFMYNKGEMTDAMIVQYNRFFDKIKYLKTQSKQEWSEEDEEIRNELIGHFESLTQCIATEERHKENRRWLNWLKSLKERFTWKPSKEQMKGIECAIRTLRHQLNVGDKRLDSLYQDLKKLREE